MVTSMCGLNKVTPVVTGGMGEKGDGPVYVSPGAVCSKQGTGASVGTGKGGIVSGGRAVSGFFF
jgi:hypothetical protein